MLAVGSLHVPTTPAIPGLDAFQGELMHTATWVPGTTAHGKRVGVVGTGASAVQLIPAVAPDAAALTVFQRTPIWCLPKPDFPLGRAGRAGLSVVPGARRVARLASQGDDDRDTAIIPRLHAPASAPQMVWTPVPVRVGTTPAGTPATAPAITAPETTAPETTAPALTRASRRAAATSPFSQVPWGLLGVVAALAVVLVVAAVLAGPIGLAAALGAEAVLVGGSVAASSRRGYTGRHSAGYRPRHAA